MSGDGGGEINFETGPYGSGQAADTSPHAPTPDTPPPVGSPLDAAYAALVAAANGDDPANAADAAGMQADRGGQYADTLAKFPANDAQSAAMLSTPGEMAQAVPQAVSGVVGAITGAVGGIVGPLAAIPQAVAQAGTQAMQTGMGALSSAASSSGAAELAGDYGDDGENDDYSDAGDYGDFSSGSGGGGPSSGGGGDGTLPATFLAPPAIPSPATFPAAAPPPAIPASAQSQPAAQPGMPGMAPMPMAPGMGGAATSNDKNATTKKLEPPTITNGRPVHGRFIANRLDTPIVNRVRVKTKNTTENNKDGQGAK